MELHDRLKAAVEARMELARAAQGADWTPDLSNSNGPTVGHWSREVEYAMWHCDDELDGCPEIARGWVAEAKHIAANDPATILRHCERDLRVLERHVPSIKFQSPKQICSVCRRPGYMMIELWPCPELRELAAAYGIEVTE